MVYKGLILIDSIGLQNEMLIFSIFIHKSYNENKVQINSTNKMAKQKECIMIFNKRNLTPIKLQNNLHYFSMMVFSNVPFFFKTLLLPLVKSMYIGYYTISHIMHANLHRYEERSMYKGINKKIS